ncbi:conserved hypothetical protein [Coccidioides posadasii str. Silveira]|uniref:Protein kinase domain-containing protein n=1 Tax=Coccidioides posadasii (strain RMSCC 757 / Silveira) TaxID=443226 RepID=E9CRK5_COCPS|nr:conserved hypothetical protein [Coccidioides posadasii str. Silveira]
MKRKWRNFIDFPFTSRCNNELSSIGSGEYSASWQMLGEADSVVTRYLHCSFRIAHAAEPLEPLRLSGMLPIVAVMKWRMRQWRYHYPQESIFVFEYFADHLLHLAQKDLPLEVTKRILRDALRGIVEFHDQDIVHTADNVFKRVIFAVGEDELDEDVDRLSIVIERQVSYFADEGGMSGFLKHLGDNPWVRVFEVIRDGFDKDHPRRPFSLWKGVDKDFKSAMTNFDPKKRITAHEALAHKWFEDVSHEQEKQILLRINISN